MSSSGYPTIALSPDGSTLWELQSGETYDVLVPINTNGETARTAIPVPVPQRTPAPRTPAPSAPVWDRLYLPSNSTAVVIAFGSDREQNRPDGSSRSR